jgi:hypothetical protein
MGPTLNIFSSCIADWKVPDKEFNAGKRWSLLYGLLKMMPEPGGADQWVGAQGSDNVQVLVSLRFRFYARRGRGTFHFENAVNQRN